MSRSTSREVGKNLSRGSSLKWLVIPLVSAIGLILLHYLHNLRYWGLSSWSGLLGIGIIGIWRWSWLCLHIIRSKIYQHIVFPRWRAKANAIPIKSLPPICFVVPTYKEKTWISQRVFKAIATEAKTLDRPVIVLVNSSSDRENAFIKKIIQSEDPELKHVRPIFMTQKDGKRKAMADSLRHLAALDLPPNTIVALMDGDSEIASGTLRKCLPFFKMFPKMGALTTDEMPIVKGSYTFSEWFHLRFSQRNYQMSSVALSNKVLCLTGRFSLFRSEAALHPSFAAQLENDTLDDWLWGEFKFLSGDDKTTWYWLLRRGYEMIYVPDAVIYSIETISGSLWERAYQNMRRWYGNMLRNSDRAIELGPKTNGFFIWLCLLDQRISMWTSLITPSLIIMTVIQGQWIAAGAISAWVICSRPVVLTTFFWGRQSQLKPIHLPLFIASQWISAVVKIWTQMNLAQQKWSNRGNQSISSTGRGIEKFMKTKTSGLLLVSQVFSFVVIIFWLNGLVSPAEDLTVLWRKHIHQTTEKIELPTEIIQARDRGIVANDNEDDSPALQNLINSTSTENKVTIELPLGEIDLDRPIEINRSNITLKGQGIGVTVLRTRFDRSVGDFAIALRPVNSADSSTLLNNVQLQDFSLSQASPLDSVIIEKVEGATLKDLNLETPSRHSLVLRDTKNVRLKYVALHKNGNEEQILKQNAIDTDIYGF